MGKEYIVAVKIEISDDIADKYPNYKYNFKSKEDFIDMLVASLYIHDVEGNSLNDVDIFGYKIKDHRILKKKAADCIDDFKQNKDE
tara:strand:- start:59 stop:316 length:258 start_codon:yes stop_codon:yes gene_type:complete